MCKKVLVTGASGFIGSNLCAHLRDVENIEILTFSHKSSHNDLKKLVFESDIIVHLAGVNQSKEKDDYQQGNTNLTKFICELIREKEITTNRLTRLVFASTIHVSRADEYGRTKLAAEDYIRQTSEVSKSNFYIFRLPGVFGKWCRPNYNSVVATFCYNSARGLPLLVNDSSSSVILAYIDDVVKSFLNIVFSENENNLICDVQPTYEITVENLKNKIENFSTSKLDILEVAEGLDRCLFATYLSYLPENKFVFSLDPKSDKRGKFVEFLRTNKSGQVSFFTIVPGEERGNHYHHTKNERFLVVCGAARFEMRNLRDDSFYTIDVDENSNDVIQTIPGWVHKIKNIGEDRLIVIVWVNENFNVDDPDTVQKEV